MFRRKHVLLQEEAPPNMLGGGAGGAPAPKTGEPTVNGTVTNTWRDTLPDDLKNDPGLSTVADVSSLAKMYVNSQKLIGKDKVVIPDQHATEDDWQAFYKKVGLPDAPDKYDVKGPKDAKYVEEAAIAELKPLAHKLGIMPKQLEGILEWYEGRAGSQMGELHKAEIEKGQANVNALKKEFGNAFDTKLAWAAKVLQEHEVDGVAELMRDPKYGNNPVLTKLLSKIGEKLYKEHDLKEGGTGKFLLSPQEANEKFNSILMNNDHPYHNADHPNHKAAVDEMKALSEAAFQD
jgi:hypothetical protein